MCLAGRNGSSPLSKNGDGYVDTNEKVKKICNGIRLTLKTMEKPSLSIVQGSKALVGHQAPVKSAEKATLESSPGAEDTPEVQVAQCAEKK